MAAAVAGSTMEERSRGRASGRPGGETAKAIPKPPRRSRQCAIAIRHRGSTPRGSAASMLGRGCQPFNHLPRCRPPPHPRPRTHAGFAIAVQPVREVRSVIRHHKLRSVASHATISLAAALALVSCSNDQDPTGDPTSAVPSTSSPTTTPTDEPTRPAWMDKYTEKEIAAYEEALDRWSTYEQRSEPIWATGKATPAARQLFQEFLPSPLWQDLFANLETYEQVEVRVPHPPAVLWTRANRIELGNGTGSVTIQECVDLTAQETTQYGKPVDFPKPFRKPIIRTIVMDKPTGHPWLIYEYPYPSVDDFQRCNGGEQ